MDDKDLAFDREKFEAVWRRVMPEAAENNKEQNAADPTEKNDARRLREFMDNEARDARVYRMLAAACSGSMRQRLHRIALDEQSHLRKLKAVYFILTGEIYRPPEACPLIRGLPETLRRKYLDEKEGSAAYKDAAEKTPVKELADTYPALAEDEARHIEIIARIIENIL